MTQQQFAGAIEMAPATLSSIFNGRTKPTLNIVEAIKKKFPDISTDWLMFGSGEMTEASPTPRQAVGDTSTAPHEAPDTPFEPALDFGDFSPAAPSQPEKTHQPSALEMGVRTTHRESTAREIKYIDKPQRKITEIRVYFDDLTFETFVPAK